MWIGDPRSVMSLETRRLELIGPHAVGRCEGYVAEEPGVVALRAELMSRKEQLEHVRRALFNFGL